MSSTICPRFSQNAWKKDLCSNCYRSKEEHKAAQKNAPKPARPTIPVPSSDARPQKSAIRPKDKKSRKTKLTFAKELAQVIGSVEWSDLDSDEESSDERDTSADAANQSSQQNGNQTDDEHDADLEKLTKVNTNFNMQNGNLLGDAQENIKRTFAAAQLGKPAKDGDGKKQTLKISVMPFGGPVTTNKVNDIRQKFAGSIASDEVKSPLPVVLKTIIKPGSVEYVTEEQSPKERPAEKSLLDEISETLARQSKDQEDQANKIKFDTQQKRSLSRHSPIVKDQAKPKISVFSKSSDSDSLASDNETASGYYDVVEASSRYENVTDDYKSPHAMDALASTSSDGMEIRNKHESSFFSNHLISEMFSGGSGASGKNGRNYNFMSQITSDGLIVTKASSDDATDSNGSSFDYATSSDEELSSMNRSESDSGIGICVASSSSTTKSSVSPSSSTSSSTKTKKTNQHTDYEDIQVQRNEDAAIKPAPFLLTKSRELAGEPDGSADPDGSEGAPALPSSPPPNDEAPTQRLSFISTPIQSNDAEGSVTKSPTVSTKSKTDKPAVPTKPTVSVIKAFVKRSPNQADMISELQSKIKGDRPPALSLLSTKTSASAEIAPASESDALHAPTKSALKKSRAPEPPTPTSDEPPSPHYENISPTNSGDKPRDPANMVEVQLTPETVQTTPAPPKATNTSKTDDQYSFLYTRNPTGSVSKSSSPVIREKDKRERATINPKFRSLNTFSSQYKQQQQQQLQNLQPVRSTTPEPAPRKSLSMSQDCLANGTEDKKKKAKFSIKKFLRINTGSSSSSSSNSASKTTETIFDKKDTLLNGKHRMHVASEDSMPPESPSSAHPSAKPRLVIIHPIDINNMEVEVVKEMSKVNEIVTGKPPAPPLRKGLDANANKPNRPPPPKSAEVRRKQLKLTDSPGSLSLLSTPKKPLHTTNSGGRSEDSVYANLGEIRSAIAPRKPERTASMREREAQLEVARKRLSKFHTEEDETDAEYAASLLLTPASSAQSTLDRCELKISAGTLESRKSNGAPVVSAAQPSVLGEGIKSSIQKMNNTIDSYLKDKRSGTDEVSPTAASPVVIVKTTKPQPPATPLRSSTLSLASASTGVVSTSPVRTEPTTVEIRSTSAYEPIARPTQTPSPFAKQPQRSSLPDQSQCYQAAVLNGSPAPARTTPALAGYCRSDIVGPGSRYQSQSMANIAPRPIGGVARSYCGSEMSDFDIYAPYSFYGAGGDADALNAGADDTVSMWSSATGANATGGLQPLHQHQQLKQRPANRLRMRKGRSVVHKNLEDNYGAVVVANHEALAQVLEQLQQTVNIAPQLRPLAHSINLRFDDFAILEGVRGVVAGRRAFHPAVWAHQTHVTLALSVDCGQMSDMSAITEFCDLVPSHYLPLMPTTERQMVQATISVLPRMFVDTLQSFGQMLRIRSDSRKFHHPAFGGSTINLSEQTQDRSATQASGSSANGGLSTLRAGQSVQNLSTFHEYQAVGGDAEPSPLPGMPSFDDLLCREVGFVLLQLVNGLKSVQAKGIEELPMSLSNVILSRELEPNKDAQAKLFVLHGLNQDASRGEDDEPMGTLCQCAHAALTELLPRTRITPTLEQILVRDRSESLSKTKAVLEFALWGPVDVDLTTGGSRERELALQRWLDLERATVLHGLCRSRAELSAYDECHLMFLVRSSAKAMCEASSILSGISDSD